MTISPVINSNNLLCKILCNKINEIKKKHCKWFLLSNLGRFTNVSMLITTYDNTVCFKKDLQFG